MPPDALDRHRAPRARLAIGEGERAPRLARLGHKGTTVGREAERVVVAELEVAAPRRVLGLELDTAAGHRTARGRGRLHANGERTVA